MAYLCALLHNFCVRTGQGDPAPRWDSDVLPHGTCSVMPNTEPATANRNVGLQRGRRLEITSGLEQSGTIRPKPRVQA